MHCFNTLLYLFTFVLITLFIYLPFQSPFFSVLICTSIYFCVYLCIFVLHFPPINFHKRIFSLISFAFYALLPLCAAFSNLLSDIGVHRSTIYGST